jgi:hypothetical protein
MHSSNQRTDQPTDQPTDSLLHSKNHSMESPLYSRDQSTAEQPLDAVEQQGTPQHPLNEPFTYRQYSSMHIRSMDSLFHSMDMSTDQRTDQRTDSLLHSTNQSLESPLYSRDQSTAEQPLDVVGQQGTPQHPLNAPGTYRHTDLHDWCNTADCTFCVERASILLNGDFSDPQYPFSSHRPLSEPPFHGGPPECETAEVRCLHVDNNQSGLESWYNIGANGQHMTTVGLSTVSEQSEQVNTSCGLLPDFYQMPYCNNSASFQYVLDRDSARSPVVGIPNSFSDFTHPSSQPFPLNPSCVGGGSNGTNSTVFRVTNLLPENGDMDTSTPSMNLHFHPYRDHRYYSPRTQRDIASFCSATRPSAVSVDTGTSPPRPQFASTRNKIYAVAHEPSITKLQDRCRLAGAEDAARNLLPMIFPAGVTLEALTRPRTSTEIETAKFGLGGGPVYLALLEQVMKTEDGGDIRAYRCRLCPNRGSVFVWKKPRDALRHLRRDHFGLGDRCPKW